MPVLRHTLAATRAAAPGMLDSAIVVAYDAQTCRAVDDEKEGSALFGLPCYHNATWLAAVQKVTRSLPAHRGSLHDVMVGRLGTTLAALCQGASVYVTDADVAFLQDPVALIPTAVDLMMTSDNVTATPDADPYHVHVIANQPHAALSLSNGVVFMRATHRLIRFYAYFAEFCLSALKEGFFTVNFADFIRSHRLRMYTVQELMSAQINRATAMAAAAAAPLEAVAGGHHRMQFNRTDLEEMSALPSVAAQLLAHGATFACTDCYFATTVVCPHALVVNGTDVDANELSQCHPTGVATKQRGGVPIVQTAFPLHVGLFPPARWASCARKDPAATSTYRLAIDTLRKRIYDAAAGGVGVGAANTTANTTSSSAAGGGGGGGSGPPLLAFHANCGSTAADKEKALKAAGLAAWPPLTPPEPSSSAYEGHKGHESAYPRAFMKRDVPSGSGGSGGIGGGEQGSGSVAKRVVAALVGLGEDLVRAVRARFRQAAGRR